MKLNKKSLCIIFLLFGIIISAWLFLNKSEPKISKPSIKKEDISEKTSKELLVTEIGKPTNIKVEDYLEKRRLDSEYDWKKPIVFYGKVIDENGLPIEGAEISLNWTNLSKTGSESAVIKSDPSGLFELKGVQGKLLTVSVKKPGYHWLEKRSKISFEYAETFSTKYHKPDLAHPVEYVLRKKLESEPLIVWDSKRRTIFPNNIVYYNFIKGSYTNTEASDAIKIQVSIESSSSDNKKFDWMLILSGDGYSFAQADESWPLKAPSGDYLEYFQLGRKSTEHNWTQGGSAKIYFRTDANTYGFLDITAKCWEGETPEARIRISSFYNPSGSQVLEYDPKKRIKH